MKLHLSTNHVLMCTRTILVILFFVFAHEAMGQHCNPSYHVTISGNTASFEDHSTADGQITGYAWTFGDGNTSNEQNPEHTFSHSGVFEVCLTIFAHNPDCHATFCHHITIEGHADSCHASYTVVQPDQHHLTFNFSDQSQSNGEIETWEWSFGDGHGSGEQNPSHTYDQPGTYVVCLFITDDSGCTHHFCHDLVIHHPVEDHCEAAYQIHFIDHGSQNVGFLDQSTTNGHITSWHWDFGDNTTSTEQNPVHLYEAPGTYTVCLYITDDNGCTSHFCHHVTIHHDDPVCNASFYLHQSHEDPFIINFTDHSSSNADIQSWLWDFGDGHTSSEQNPSHNYDHPGTYLVCLYIATADSSCIDHYCHHLVIHLTEVDDHNDHVNQKMANKHNQFFKGSGNPSESITTQQLSPEVNKSEPGKSNSSFVYSPNPFDDFLLIEFNLEQDAIVNVAMFDMAGKEVFKSERQTPATGSFHDQLSLGYLPDGSYFLKVEINGEPFIRKVIKGN